MQKIAIISPSVRKGRISHRVALYFDNLLKELNLANPDILDLSEYNFPLFNERLKYQESPSSGALEFAKNVKSADGVIIISPEYNGGIPASLKNAIDLLTDEWKNKPVAFVTVSDGNFAGTQANIPLQFSLWKLGAVTVPGPLRIPNIKSAFDESGIPEDKPAMDKRAAAFVSQFLRWIDPLKQ